MFVGSDTVVDVVDVGRVDEGIRSGIEAVEGDGAIMGGVIGDILSYQSPPRLQVKS